MTAKGDRFRYSHDQLDAIACEVKKAGIDADLTPGGALHLELERYAALFHLAHVHGGLYLLLSRLTGLPQSTIDTMRAPPKRKAAALEEMLERIAATRATLKESVVPYERLMATNLARELKVGGDLPPMLDNDDILALIRAGRVLERRAAIVQQHRDPLRAERSRSADNARRLHTGFLIMLAELWIRVAGRGPCDKDMQEILLACSKPVFPQTTASAIASFTKRHYRPRAGKIVRSPGKKIRSTGKT